MRKSWSSEDGQGIAEYAVMFALILVLVISTVRVIGSHSDEVFSRVGNVLQSERQGDGD